MAHESDENKTFNGSPINDHDDTPTSEHQPNEINNETTNSLQLNEIEERECEESFTDSPREVLNSNVIILGSVPPNDTENPKPQPKRRKPNELEALGVTEVKEEFDSFIDETNKIYRKYKLRNVAKPNYKIPTIHDLPKPQLVKTETHACPHAECTKQFSSSTKLNLHMRREHEIKYKCSLCSETFDSNQKLVAHKSVHENEIHMFVCHGCKLAFSDQCDYLIHKFTHVKRKFECPECGTITLHRSTIERHILLHFDRKETCPICSEQIHITKLPTHVRQHNCNRECVECGKKIMSKKEFNHHMAVHTGVKLHQCLYCGKGFITKQSKSTHTRIHTNERIYSCKLCPRTFIQQTDMKRHRATHDKTRKFECDVCQKRFIQKNDLYCHMKTHTKKYCCPECGKRFGLMVSLKLHLLHVHSSERPVDCKPCGKSFASEHHYREHTASKIHQRNIFKESKHSK